MSESNHKDTTGIEQWMINFKLNWITKDIPGVLALFTDDVEYWESETESYYKKEGEMSLYDLWKQVLTLDDMRLEYLINGYNPMTNIYEVKWKFNHKSESWSGMYLIRLDVNGFCTYFKQIVD